VRERVRERERKREGGREGGRERERERETFDSLEVPKFQTTVITAREQMAASLCIQRTKSIREHILCSLQFVKPL
jgi:hypothetical protein